MPNPLLYTEADITAGAVDIERLRRELIAGSPFSNAAFVSVGSKDTAADSSTFNITVTFDVIPDGPGETAVDALVLAHSGLPNTVVKPGNSLTALNDTGSALVAGQVCRLTTIDQSGDASFNELFQLVGNAHNVDLSGGDMAMAVLNAAERLIAVYVGSNGDELRTYQFDGTDWAQVGAGFFIQTSGNARSAMAPLDETSIAFWSGNDDELSVFTWDTIAETWSSGPVVTPAGAASARSRLAGLDSNRIAFHGQNEQLLMTYRRSAPTGPFVLVGNIFNHPVAGSNFPELISLGDDTVAYIDAIADTIQTLTFDGTNWANVGNASVQAFVGTAIHGDALDATTIALIDATDDSLTRYSFDGTDWAPLGDPTPYVVAGFAPELLAFDSVNIVTGSGPNTSDEMQSHVLTQQIPAETQLVLATASASTDRDMDTLVVVVADIADQAVGSVARDAIIGDVDTNTARLGDPVYLSTTTPGALQAIRPVSPDFAHQVGVVKTRSLVPGVADGMILFDPRDPVVDPEVVVDGEGEPFLNDTGSQIDAGSVCRVTTIHQGGDVTFDPEWQEVGNVLAVVADGEVFMTVMDSRKRRVAAIGRDGETLQMYQFDGADWAAVGSGLAITTATRYAIGALDDHTVVLAHDGAVGDNIATYEFNPFSETWSQVGTPLGASLSAPALTVVDFDEVAICTTNTNTIQMYQRIGNVWSALGNTVAYSYGTSTSQHLATLDSATKTIATLADVDDLLRTFRFDGTDWNLVGNALALSVASPTVEAIDATTILVRNGNDIDRYTFDGTDWTKIEDGTASPGETFVLLDEQNILLINDTGGVTSWQSFVHTQPIEAQEQLALATCDAASDGNEDRLVIALADIPDGDVGEAARIAVTNNVDLNDARVGDPVYLSATVPGGMQSSKPSYPDFACPVGIVKTRSLSPAERTGLIVFTQGVKSRAQLSVTGWITGYLGSQGTPDSSVDWSPGVHVVVETITDSGFLDQIIHVFAQTTTVNVPGALFGQGNGLTNFSIDKDGNYIQEANFPGFELRRRSAYLGNHSHNGTDDAFILNSTEPGNVARPGWGLVEVLADRILSTGSAVVDGMQVSPGGAGDLSIFIAAGNVERIGGLHDGIANLTQTPHQHPWPFKGDPVPDPFPFFSISIVNPAGQLTFDNLPGFTNPPDFNPFIDPNNYQVPFSGVITPVPAGKYQNLRIYFYGGPNFPTIMYGPQVYDSLEDAARAATTEPFFEHPDLLPAAHLAWLTVQQGTTDLVAAVAAGKAIFTQVGPTRRGNYTGTGPLGTGSVFAQISDSGPQKVIVANTPEIIDFDTDNNLSGIDHSVSTDIRALQAGPYQFIAQAQVERTAGGGDIAWNLWLRKGRRDGVISTVAPNGIITAFNHRIPDAAAITVAGTTIVPDINGAQVISSLSGDTFSIDTLNPVTTITAAADGGVDTVTMTAAGHGLINGDIVTQVGDTIAAYTGQFTVANVAGDDYDITVAGAFPGTDTGTVQENIYVITDDEGTWTRTLEPIDDVDDSNQLLNLQSTGQAGRVTSVINLAMEEEDVVQYYQAASSGGSVAGLINVTPIVVGAPTGPSIALAVNRVSS